MTEVLEINGLEHIDAVADALLQLIGNRRIVAFYGNLGAGKTTFIKAICRRLGVVDVVSSPTFSIINEYRTAAGDLVYHFDFYRLKQLQEAIDIGVEEYLESGSFCFMEWSDRVEALLPERYVRVSLEAVDEGRRRVLVEV